MQHINRGHAELIIGPMFSGKTTRLIATIDRYARARKKCIILKHNCDKRYDGLCTHNGQSCSICTICARDIDHMIEIINSSEYINIDVIGIDEVQFFTPNDDIARKFAMWIDHMCLRGYIVICAGLDTNWEREPFPYLSILLSRVDCVTKLCAVCVKCGADAPFSARIMIDGVDYSNPIGGADKYESLCRWCYVQHMDPISRDSHK